MDHRITEIYWSRFEHALFLERPLYVAATSRGLCRITWPSETFDTLSRWSSKEIPGALLIEAPERMADILRQLQEYCEGSRQAFTLPLDMRGTTFQQSVWQALTQIPYGKTRSYSDIAEAVGRPAAVRAVGTANGANPIPIVVPCHRVIGKNAALTGFRGGLQAKEDLLQLEGFHGYTAKGHARFQF
ncbi:methylated-DNA--[protein]-cysteine S-methyltransferase [Paenibacillus filicis]|uniref:Methylated-DNA--protein-cysteine methyltransferase n=1 Tax=Paenibacillus gyeongsangnamensis TaxID=3388067 RepID=A0ABT4Q5R0_9BACL|nr:methylated-DNA--[protein]-cysteine S-methyltransferase [Paenibacillus filicis]MCZ8512209.1 methylated-DNA--[protein]-cysteine S-methyltransferase [Paenibacillus filicis]